MYKMYLKNHTKISSCTLPVLKFCEALAGEVRIDGAGEDEQLVAGQRLLHLEVIHAEPHGDVVVVEQHPLEHGGVAVSGQRLERVVEVSVVPAGPHGEPRQHRGVQLARPLVPLLPDNTGGVLSMYFFTVMCVDLLSS